MRVAAKHRSAPGGPNVVGRESDFLELGGTSGDIWATFGGLWPKSVAVLPTSVEHRPNLVRCWSSVARFRPTSGNFGPKSTEVGPRNPLGIGQTRPFSANFRAESAEFGPPRAAKQKWLRKVDCATSRMLAHMYLLTSAPVCIAYMSTSCRGGVALLWPFGCRLASVRVQVRSCPHDGLDSCRTHIFRLREGNSLQVAGATRAAQDSGGEGREDC